ncbi:hypothetical protein VCHE40_0266A, partial [Vibrio cholerae HE-40]
MGWSCNFHFIIIPS